MYLRKTLLCWPAEDNPFPSDPLGRISCIHQQMRVGHDLPVIITPVVGHKHYTILLSQVFKRSASHLQFVFASSTNEQKLWIGPLASSVRRRSEQC